MIHDYLEIENAEGMPEMADSAVALEFLMSIKPGSGMQRQPLRNRERLQ